MPGIIDFRHLFFGADEPVKKVSVIGKEQQPLRCLIQPSHGAKLPVGVFLRDKLHDSLLPGVLRGGDEALRLIEHQHHPVYLTKRLPVQGDFLALGGNFPAAVPFRNTVHRHSSGFQDILHLAPGGKP